MYLFGTHRSVVQRLRLSMNRDLGAGNFFWHACAVARDPDRPLVHRMGPDGLDGLSLRALHDRVIRYGNWYQANGVGPGTRVGVYTVDGLLGVLHHVAITSLGGITVLANPNMAAMTAAQYFRYTDTTMVVGDAVLLPELTTVLTNADGRWNDAVAPLNADISTVDREATSMHNAVGHRYRHVPSDLVLISHSSGTTGEPKPTAFAHDTFSVGKRERLWKFPSAVTDRMVTALPHSHSSGVSYISLAIMLGLPTLMLDDPSGAAVAAAMNTFLPTVVIGFPLSLADLPVETLSTPAKQAVHTWMGMGDASHERHIRPLLALSRTGSTYVDGLGSSEMGMVLFKHAHTIQSTRYGRAIGEPVRVVSKAVVLDENGNEVPDGQAGLLGVRTPSITPGYVNEPGMTAQARSGEYFLTGDVVRHDPDGMWYHLDRTPDVITTSSGPVYSLQLEEIVLTETGAFDAAVVAVDDPDSPAMSSPIAVVLFKGGATLPRAALDSCNLALTRAGLATLAAVVVATDRASLPVGVTGKVLKRVLRERHQHVLTEPVRTGTALDSW
ncbi:class I adenylate-forming enzyme family protein [Kibdelosporangium phytohabitans]|uniref:AMP-dependent synthetase n=1 Tax=Kibdelosporangium phytohabitans TaxID=860235 RepID=A0A0N9I5U2_9PSEU|nr:class I adenylate-forming enzyme family protein [Kibdelosporangium phytohabitans]ALG09958.1 AMP-dependent synthetase [Kibdelosporangium phytohabitans]MBE1468629.1 acyl-coenzyme A synthetase/AMP-(fatty) acid ligase [Kibdelosporangium phytohabitans]